MTGQGADRLSVPVGRAIDRALRMLALTYRMTGSPRGTSAAEVRRTVPGYREPGDPAGSTVRKFEHDKKELRAAGIPITVELIGAPPVAFYRVRPRELFLPSRATSPLAWAVLDDGRPALQAVGDGLPAVSAHTAAAATSALLALAPALGLTLRPWRIPQAMLANGPLLLEWVHALLVITSTRSRLSPPVGGGSVATDDLSAITGLPRTIIRRIGNGGQTPGAPDDTDPPLRVTCPPEADRLTVQAPAALASWRPQRPHVDGLALAAQQLGRPLPRDLTRVLRDLARGALIGERD